MPLQLERVTSQSDVSKIVKVHYASFLTSTVMKVIYPEGATQSVTADTEKKFSTALDTEPSLRLLKAIDDETGDIVAFAKWYIFDTAEAESRRTDIGHWEMPEDCNAAAAADFFGQIVEARKTMAGKPHCRKPRTTPSGRRERGSALLMPALTIHLHFLVLDILATHPGHWRRGAGVMLVNWGTAEADRLHLPCFLEASPAGHKLYDSCGFRDTGKIEMDMGKYEAGLPLFRQSVMLRPAR